MRVFDVTRGGESNFDGGAQIHRDYVPGSPLRNASRMTAFPATAFKHHFAHDEFRPHRRDPVKELLLVSRVIVRELLPRPAETFGGCLLVGCDAFELGKPRYAADDRKSLRTRSALKLAGKNLDTIVG
jgi:hypothetical protein